MSAEKTSAKTTQIQLASPTRAPSLRWVNWDSRKYAAKAPAQKLTRVRGLMRSSRSGSIGACGLTSSTCCRIWESRSSSRASSIASSMARFSACFSALLVLRSLVAASGAPASWGASSASRASLAAWAPPGRWPSRFPPAG
ncbi:hypothetical protein SANTM175S_08338 [Streptomyces antimycoticus]